MKKIFILLLLQLAVFNCQAQAIYTEVQNMMHRYDEIRKNDKLPLYTRKSAAFKYDAIYYLISTIDHENQEEELGLQVDAMVEYVNLFNKTLDNSTKDQDKVIQFFSETTIMFPRVGDPDKDLVNAYVGNEDFLTQFCLDTNWIKALRFVKK